MAIAIRIAVFAMIFNLAAGILGVALGDLYTNDDMPLGYRYSEQRETYGQWNGSVSAPGAETASGWWIKFVDFISIGYYQKLQGLLDSTVYGIVGILKDLRMLDPKYYVYFYAVITIIYILGVVEIFTGKLVARGNY